MMFQEIVTFIAGRTGFTIGTTLQAGHRLATAPDRCVLIAESGGGATVPELPDRADFLIQALSRAKKYFEARDDAWTVYTALHGTAGWNMPNISGSGDDYIAWTVEALAIPQYIGQDVDGRYEFSVNFIFRMAQASCGAGPSGP
ncbi:MAG: minor capsid protein [Dehalococcoidia bacterium]|nr:minor capsid protein [Dehalococcoidia bacterium]